MQIQKKTKEEIDQFIEDNKGPRLAACTLGCGQVIKDQLVDHTKHDCIIPSCTNWKTKCRTCRGVLGPTGNLLHGKDSIYQEWDTHDRKIRRILEQDNNLDDK